MTWADTWTRRLTTLICADSRRMSLMRRSCLPTNSAAEGHIGDTRIAPKVPSAHITPYELCGGGTRFHEGAYRLRELPHHCHHQGWAFPRFVS